MWNRCFKKGYLTAPTSLTRVMKITFEARVIKNAAILGPFIWQTYTLHVHTSNIILYYSSFDLICIYCISWFCARRFDRTWSRNQFWWRIVVPLYWLHLMRTQYKQCCTPLALYFPRQPDTLLSHDYQYSRLNQLLCQKDPRWVLNKVLELVETLMRKSPCMRKYCSSQFTLCNISTSASSHSSSDMLCGSSGFRARCRFSLQLLRQSGKMPRPAPMDSDVEDGSPTTASKEFEVVCFKRSWWGVLVSGCYLLPAAISVATFWCLLFSVSVGTNKRSRALSMP